MTSNLTIMSSQKGKGKPGWSRFAETEEKRVEYLKNLAKGMNKKKAALAAGFSLSMARKPGARIENRPEMLVAIQSLEKALLEGIPTELLVQKFAEGLEATVPKAVHRNGRGGIREFPDYRTRLEYLEKIALFSGRHEPKSRTEHTGKDGGPIELTAMTHEQLKQRKQWLEEQLGLSDRGGFYARALPPAPERPEKG